MGKKVKPGDISYFREEEDARKAQEFNQKEWRPVETLLGKRKELSQEALEAISNGNSQN